jgi:hypothetical protein
LGAADRPPPDLAAGPAAVERAGNAGWRPCCLALRPGGLDVGHDHRRRGARNHGPDAPPARRGDPALHPGRDPVCELTDRLSEQSVHLVRELPLFQNVGVVDRVDDRYGDHCVVVRFLTIACPPFGSPWVDAFTPEELVVVES